MDGSVTGSTVGQIIPDDNNGTKGCVDLSAILLQLPKKYLKMAICGAHFCATTLMRLNRHQNIINQNV